jgi:PleD family two-component response regulator
LSSDKLSRYALIAKPPSVIAVLDEDGDDRLLLRDAFKQVRQDIVIRSFEKAEPLLDYLNREGDADLIILGLHLPWENMFDTIASIKSNLALRHIPLIVLIGMVPDAIIMRFYDLGANTVIARPDRWDELVGVLKKTCDYWFGPLKM